MNDLISRQDAIDAVAKWDRLEFYLPVYFKQLLEALPSAQQWIPCSERLPSDEDYDETFTVTIQCEHQDGWDNYVTGYADWTPHGWDIQSNYIGQIKVVAWMLLPEPWKGEEAI